MTNEEQTDIKVGITVLAGIALLLFGIGWAKGWNTAGHEIRYQAAFQNAGGLELGDPVTLNGVKRGIVREVETRQSDVLVTMGFSDKLDLHEDASASISMLELMTGKKVELHPGTSSKPLPPNTIIPGVFSGTSARWSKWLHLYLVRWSLFQKRLTRCSPRSTGSWIMIP